MLMRSLVIVTLSLLLYRLTRVKLQSQFYNQKLSQKWKVEMEHRLKFDHNADTIITEAKQAIAEIQTVLSELLESTRDHDANFNNTIQRLAFAENEMKRKQHHLIFFQYVSSLADIRAASARIETMFEEFSIESRMRQDLYHLVTSAAKRTIALDDEDRLLINQMIESFIDNGFGLREKPKQARLKEIRKSISTLTVAFHSHQGESDEGVWLTRHELENVPGAFLNDLVEDSENQKLWLRLTGLNLSTILKYCSRQETRRKVFIAYNNQCKQNVARFKEVLMLRDEAARLLGYGNHAQFRLKEKMTKSPDAINVLLENLKVRVIEKAQIELNELKAIKFRDQQSQGLPPDGKYYLWDHAYYERLLAQERHVVNEPMISEYFPLLNTLANMLSVCEKLFGLRFNRVTMSEEDRAQLVWDTDIQLYDAFDEGGDFLGHLYIDLFPRPNKYGGAANFNLRPGYIDSHGNRIFPATALVCNFARPTRNKPSLLLHQDVVMLFHELGHCIHDLVSKTKWARFHGTATVVDFCETPSMLLELWCWDSDFLQAISCHYSKVPEVGHGCYGDKNTFGRLPREMIDRLIKAKRMNRSLFMLRQLHIALYDMYIHQPKSVDDIQALDTSETWNRMKREITLLDDPQSDGQDSHWGHGEVSIGYLMEDYDAGFYSYISSQVYAADIFYKFFKTDVLNGVEGRRYRRAILEKGGAKDASVMLEDYLGRAPSLEAFYRELQLPVSEDEQKTKGSV